jgi:lysophospholipase L1-like esterase
MMGPEMRTLICHGDSLTAASDLERPFIWPSLIEKQLQLKIINSGIAGDTTGGLLSRFYPSVVQQQPDFVLIMGGTNDLWWDLDVKLIRANVFAMTCQAEHHAIVPLIGLPPPIVIERAVQFFLSKRVRFGEKIEKFVSNFCIFIYGLPKTQIVVQKIGEKEDPAYVSPAA